MNPSSGLRLVGERVGILPEYVNYDGSQRFVTPDETYKAILQSMGIRADDDASTQRALESLNQDEKPQATQRSIQAKCMTCGELSVKPQLRGIWTNLYTIRSETNWGAGDFGDVRRLVKWAGEVGLDFVALNPLHALRNRGHDISPYRPVSRLYRNETYLEMEAIPEFQHDAVRERLTSIEFRAKLDQTRSGSLIDYEAVASLKREVLQLLHQSFRNGQAERGGAYREYLEREGAALRNFATFMALDDHFSSPDRGVLDWRAWPDELRNVQSSAVEKFRQRHAEEVDFHSYVQFELDRQLGVLVQFAKESGLSAGLMGDLAIGTAPDGSDPWSFPDLFLSGVSIGAPPDDLGPAGQNWGLPPINPRALRDTGFEFWKRLLRNNLAHMGALRIDHVMGLLRQFWIPEGFDGSQGAYVQFPAEELFSILAEKSRRAGAIIVGEDLGTVPEGFRGLLRRFGVLSTRVVYFERDWNGQFHPASRYPSDAYVVVGTHDMAPLAGFAEGADLRLRRKVELIPDDKSLGEAVEGRKNDWAALKHRLAQERIEMDPQADEREAVCRALVQFLFKTPACMVGISLDDLAGEREPVNVPGVGQDRHPSWSRRMTKSLEEIMSSPSIRSTLSESPHGDSSLRSE
jgi:4-alpha-glucanotransferase